MERNKIGNHIRIKRKSFPHVRLTFSRRSDINKHVGTTHAATVATCALKLGQMQGHQTDPISSDGDNTIKSAHCGCCHGHDCYHSSCFSGRCNESQKPLFWTVERCLVNSCDATDTSLDDLRSGLLHLLLPDSLHDMTRKEGVVLLFYYYCDLADPWVAKLWQVNLCKHLGLAGKVRLATEGINGTVGGSVEAARLYMEATMAYPPFRGMTSQDFKRSAGGTECFQELRVGIYQELVPLGIDPCLVSYKDAGPYLTPVEFHEEVARLLEAPKGSNAPLLLDCRNFYESMIGRFLGSVTPNIRKFSYFPEYVEKNLVLFCSRRVLMYCTGGIRCERASAFLRSKGVCTEVWQLHGGIHRYLDVFPNGFFCGKLFVFDERYAIASNERVIGACNHCAKPWDQYNLCTTPGCRQLVLACTSCQTEGHTVCCRVCRAKGASQALINGEHLREECECTKSRERVPLEAEGGTSLWSDEILLKQITESMKSTPFKEDSFK
uniref:thiosulfate sulfurtransferase/rhodanese-like domain-containing protein 2 isoform X2 n=1 Tax=Myxine glutinosa TaxID=7769 RepID=UPI00358F9A50